jgi:hypothetical protein
MTGKLLVFVLIVVVMLSAGQILLKFAALTIPPLKDTSLLTIREFLLNPYFLGAFTLYVGSGVLWAWILRSAALSKIYPFIALTFILVPAGGIMIFNEKATVGLGVGTALILLGVVIVAQP